MIKRYIDDQAIVRETAEWIAEMPDDVERGTALTVLFEECGRMAEAYADPVGVAKLLVNGAVESYHSARGYKAVLSYLGVAA
ncbi:hypothetical protein ACFY2K_11750 [Kitasatospora sp. NPDC001309]|uniref:hypothetical protein n=1 Tax=Kitasatospora sp. NPDC001309 TaxID=3364013 RepID=UPI0036AB1F7B